ncbi:hypothetical protein FOZ61_004219 [Perkinsus olseni]|uniref:Phosphatidic acid phosphatase type 2/haloperoxidase domain-containing protein n=1 Tax=Perkinsus olseni TaxID=32597 RepID=A0A7J6LLL6_PEROL|nr:hypothetical protein FOZ61_004219 [Perkinsus olseni]KAF4669324.1 hypothetical protein FOL46_001502 [Perkinsus olseni]
MARSKAAQKVAAGSERPLTEGPSKRTADNVTSVQTGEGPVGVGNSHNSLAKLDRYISTTYVHSLKLGLLDYLVAVPALVCSTYVVPFLPVIVSIKMGTQRGMEYLICVLLCVAVSLTLKKVFKRVRPTYPSAPREVNLRWMESNFSFPSGDSVQAGALATFLALCDNAPKAYALVPCVMFARVYFGFHWIGDTIFGALLGVLITATLLPTL